MRTIPLLLLASVYWLLGALGDESSAWACGFPRRPPPPLPLCVDRWEPWRCTPPTLGLTAPGAPMPGPPRIIGVWQPHPARPTLQWVGGPPPVWPQQMWRGAYALPILGAALLVGWQVRRLRRLARLRGGVAGTLLREVPGTITLRRSDGSELTIHLEGGEVVRGSALGLVPAGLRRGLALDLLEGSPVTACGLAVGDGLYRDVPSLRVRPGDLALVGCTPAEAQRRVGWRLTAALLLLSSVLGSTTAAVVLLRQ